MTAGVTCTTNIFSQKGINDVSATMGINQKTKIKNLDYTEITKEVIKRGAQLNVKKTNLSHSWII